MSLEDECQKWLEHYDHDLQDVSLADFVRQKQREVVKKIELPVIFIPEDIAPNLKQAMVFSDGYNRAEDELESIKSKILEAI
jgi:phage terminase small subunit